MHADIRDMLKRQSEWQRKRARLSWEEKLRLSVVMRQSLSALKKGKDAGPSAGKEQAP